MACEPRSSRLLALLGPTNTGKTHRAVERMLEHRTGMIGLPLRLLAREVYDRVTSRLGEQAVALVTGEEKRIPPRPRYWVSTVEAMPLDRQVDFLAVDEIQLACHRERGHVFTDRLLHARGRLETWFLGAATMRALVEELVPAAEIRGNPRLSRLGAAGSVRLGALAPRTAIVAFSLASVYEMAERIRARRGGAAVVLGALSPRARNAQVALYQAGEVDYLVATDAIGMGLNLDIDQVVFAELRKFDGREIRLLEAAELAQIAGRAGRYKNDGSFGTLAPLPPLPPGIERAIETHEFPLETRVEWRNRELDTGSLEALIRSLRRRPRSRSLRPAAEADDLQALVRLAADAEVQARARDAEGVKLLWEACQIPDYRQLLLEDHVGLLREVFLQLSGPEARLDPDWMARRIERLDQPSGDIDDLLMRMAFIRTWTYIAHRPGWVPDAPAWQGRTRAIEDALSDALHERLVRRFVDQGRGAVRVPEGAGAWTRAGAGAGDGGPLRDGSPFAVLARLREARPDAAQEQDRWVGDIVEAPHAAFRLDPRGRVLFRDHAVARLSRGIDLQRPEVVVLDEVVLGKAARSRVLRRLVAWARDLAGEVLGPLPAEPREALTPAARGLLFQLEQGLGTTEAKGARDQVRALERAERDRLRSLGVRFGRAHVYLASALGPDAVARRAALAAAYFGSQATPEAPRPGAVSVPLKDGCSEEAYRAIGFPVLGPRAVRADVIERVRGELDRMASGGPFEPVPRVSSLLGCGAVEAAGVVKALGYQAVGEGRFGPRPAPPSRRRARRRRGSRRAAAAAAPGS